MLSWGIYDGKNQNHSLNRRYTAVFSVVTQRSSPLTPHLFTIKTPPTLLQKNKNQEQRRKFHIALLTKKVSTLVCYTANLLVREKEKITRIVWFFLTCICMMNFMCRMCCGKICEAIACVRLSDSIVRTY